MEEQSHTQKLTQTLQTAYSFIKKRELIEAEVELERALGLDFDSAETIAALKCLHFWKDRFGRIDDIGTAFEKGEFLFREWKYFNAFLQRVEQVSEPCLYSLKQAVFSLALEEFSRLHCDNTDNQEPDILFRIGRCFKGLGDYQHAVEHMEKASRQRKEDPGLYAELADCYAFINEIKAAKAFFREAFFIDPQAVDTCLLESMMIRRLVEEVAAKGYNGLLLNEWLPVYGTICGVFNIKRELRPLEYGKLRQNIHTLEQQIIADGLIPDVVPRLLNRYFWLIDHYIVTRDSKERIDEVLTRIKNLDENIYSAYVN